jgi:hypothetical protein
LDPFGLVPTISRRKTAPRQLSQRLVERAGLEWKPSNRVLLFRLAGKLNRLEVHVADADSAVLTPSRGLVSGHATGSRSVSVTKAYS